MTDLKTTLSSLITAATASKPLSESMTEGGATPEPKIVPVVEALQRPSVEFDAQRTYMHAGYALAPAFYAAAFDYFIERAALDPREIFIIDVIPDDEEVSGLAGAIEQFADGFLQDGIDPDMLTNFYKQASRAAFMSGVSKWIRDNHSRITAAEEQAHSYIRQLQIAEKPGMADL